MKLSVVIPCFNHGFRLPEKLRQLKAQTRRPDEIVIVDDASTDNTPAIIESLRSPIPIHSIRNDCNLKVPETCNRGVDACSGDHVFLTAADDDLIDSGAFARAEDAFANWIDDAAFWCTPSWFLNMDTGIGWHGGQMFNSMRWVPNYGAENMMKDGTYAAQGQTMVWRKAAFPWYRSRHRWQHDFLPPLQAALKYGFLYDPTTTVRLNTRSGSYCTAGRQTPAHAEALRAMVKDAEADSELRAAMQGSPLWGQFGFPILKAVKGTPFDAPGLRWHVWKHEMRRLVGRNIPVWLHKALMR